TREVRPEYERNSPRMSSNSYVNLKIATCLVRYADDRLIDQRFLKVNLTIPETCTIGPGDRTGAEAETPSVTCTHGTPFMLTRMSTEIPAVPRRRTGAGEAGTWTVTF
ncbi:hypothetical protein LGM69_01995, partial [Burkholderia multivorans]|nr:hypothetical protein [Burkholderia multivorans]